jgi:hypothetical protein
MKKLILGPNYKTFYSVIGATTFSIMAFSITTCKITIKNVPLSITTLSITTFSITIGKCDNQSNDTEHYDI